VTVVVAWVDSAAAAAANFAIPPHALTPYELWPEGPGGETLELISFRLLFFLFSLLLLLVLSPRN